MWIFNFTYIQRNGVKVIQTRVFDASLQRRLELKSFERVSLMRPCNGSRLNRLKTRMILCVPLTLRGVLATQRPMNTNKRVGVIYTHFFIFACKYLF